MFEPLVHVDCDGTVHPGLADAWVSDASGQVWTFTLRQGARLPSGMPATASQVVSGWLAGGEKVEALGIDTTVALDDRRFSVTLHSAHQSVPHLFADPALIILDDLATVGLVDRVFSSPRGHPVVDLQLKPNSDLRDALDREVDLVVTRDPALVDYVSNRAEFETFPLPWSSTYVLLETASRQGELSDRLSPVSVRSTLAKDAVQANARAAEPPYWWSDQQGCPTATQSSSSPSSRVVYRKDDEVARGLAQRIVALASTSAGLRAVGLDAAEFDAALRGASERAYVIGLPRQSFAPCRDASVWPAGARLQPLIDTRAHAIVRKGAPPMTVEWDGTPRVAEP